jgi:hypothetical protein
MAFKDTDKILVNRDGVDYQADLGPLLGGGGGDPGGGNPGDGGLDAILNAPVVKGPIYLPHHDKEGEWLPMDLIDGDGRSGSTFNAPGNQYLTGSIQYKNSTNIAFDTSQVCIAQFKDLAATVTQPANSSAVFAYAMGGGTVHVRGNYASKIIVRLDFTDVNGDAAHLFITCQNYVYRSMRREAIDLREMEELDAALKLKKSQAIAKLKSSKKL